MKHFLGTLTAVLAAVFTQAQTLNLKVNSQQHQPLAGINATFSKEGKKWTIISNNSGDIVFTPGETGNYDLTLEAVGKKTVKQSVTLQQGASSLTLTLEELDYMLAPLEVRAIRASDKAPFTKTNIDKADIAKQNLGQDLPFLLNQTPSVIVNSDAGNGVGYTAMRIRGTDGSRINVTLNGIPYNDAESQGSFFVDLPDLASSASSIQIQRGVGTSTNGAGAFGATLNIATNEFSEKPYAESNNSFGSFNTWKNTIKAGTGLINDHFTVDARISRLQSDGYIDRASSDLKALYLTGAYVSKNTSVRFNLITGKEKTYQAWYGVPDYILATGNRTYNPAGLDKPGTPYDNQTDNYQQDHYQLFVNQALGNDWTLNIASFLTRGKGYYEEYVANQFYADYGLPNVVLNGTSYDSTDLVRDLWLNNYFYGQTFSLQYKQPSNEITFGGSWTIYDGKHYGNIIWANMGIPKDYQYYYLTARKTDMNAYAKWLHQLNRNWSLFGDLQYRHVQYNIDGFESNPGLFIKRNFNFINPKAGISYNRNGWNAYFSYALANKEPNRTDFEAQQVQQPKKETLHDFELGVERKQGRYNWGATVYYMLYKDQLVLTGARNDVGAYTRINTPNSYRLGLELQGGVVLNKWLNIQANTTISRNKIKAFTSYIDEYDGNGKLLGQQATAYSNTDISFSPAIIVGGSINLTPVKNLELSLLSKYVGKQYLDNTQDNERKLNDYYVQDARVIWTVKHFLFNEWNFTGQVNNLFNRKYEANGANYPGIYDGTPTNYIYYSTMAGTNFMLGVNIKL
ncbi:iron complex outermembrane recepter protein [Filimonas lacunae]|uniref:Iron complex outermembrane recepter protein n=1 Tax=Filimonas lacunae TaxID=477680 RepID=A0A173MKV6_9BACT|nr:TonB-dependent receptor [Filimonas lacunae]BAV08273.1 thiamin-regulated outer membrane receptor Omr1 [Filimonas lacunae]SIT33217.1 iron complex outermembrane recepter protein [Filimonas lacunae]